jgi:hypothetical protein
MDGSASAEGRMQKEGKADHKRSLLVLWFVVSGLWTAATLLRIYRVWTPFVGSQIAVEGPLIWIALVLPPLMFAGILASIHMTIRNIDKL